MYLPTFLGLSSFCILTSFSSGSLASEYNINVNGSFYPKNEQHSPTAPTSISLAVPAGTYVAFQANGTYSLKGVPQFALPADMAILLKDSAGNILAPMKYGDDTGRQAFPLSAVGGCDRGFANGADAGIYNKAYRQSTILRIPEAAKMLQVSGLPCVAPSLVPVERPYLRITYPNRSATGLASAKLGPIVPSSTPEETPISEDVLNSHLRSVRDSAEYQLMKRAALASNPDSAEAATSSCLTAGKFATPMPSPQYRGWYETNQWAPQKSRFCDKDVGCPRKNLDGSNRKHLGVDLFSPEWAEIRTPLGGIGKRASNVAGYGNVYTVTFFGGIDEYTLLFAHLASLVGPNNKSVQPGTLIGYSGCTGNAETGCGTELPSGGRTDHLHYELIRSKWTNTAIRCDIAKNLTTVPQN